MIGTRGSELALWQANHVKSLLENAGHAVEIKIIKTQGDKIQHLSFSKMEGKGFFTKELEAHLLEGTIDLAVHSCKDLETKQPEGLCIDAMFNRADVRDLLLCKNEAAYSKLKNEGGCIGTSSARRKSQLLRIFPEVTFKDIRGNVPTRIQKLEQDEELDAIMLAKAGVDRLQINLDHVHALPLEVADCIPAAAQGALAIQIRENDAELKQVISFISDAKVKSVVEAERYLLAKFGGGCQKPVGVHIYEKGNAFEVLISNATTEDEAGIVSRKTLSTLTESELDKMI